MTTNSHLTDEDMFTRLDGQIKAEDQETSEAHLTACPVCRARAGEISKLFADLETLPDLPAPRDFTPGVLAAVRRKAAGRAPQRLPGPIWVGAALQLAAALAILSLAGPHLAYPQLAGLALPDPAGWLESISRQVDRLSSVATEWSAAVEIWFDGLEFAPFGSGDFDPASLLSALAALLPLIASSGLLWVVGNALLLRKPRRLSGER